MFCIPVIARNTAEAIEKIARANTLADMLEIRLDVMETFDLQKIIKAASKPVLVTYRSVKEGGKGLALPESHADYLLTAIKEGADLVDMELSLPRRWREKIFDIGGRSGVIISTHVNDGTPSKQDLERIFRDCTATGANIIKIVTKAETWADNLRVLELIPKVHDLGVKIIAFCMGPIGRISRVLSHLMGGYLTFVSLEHGEESADGQMTVMEMRKILEHFSS